MHDRDAVVLQELKELPEVLDGDEGGRREEDCVDQLPDRPFEELLERDLQRLLRDEPRRRRHVVVVVPQLVHGVFREAARPRSRPRARTSGSAR